MMIMSMMLIMCWFDSRIPVTSSVASHRWSWPGRRWSGNQSGRLPAETQSPSQSENGV